MTDEKTVLAHAIRAEAESVTARPGLTEAIVRAASEVAARPVADAARARTGWRSWVLPVAAAALVAVVAGAVVVGAKALRHNDTAIRPSPVLSSGPTGLPSSSAVSTNSPSSSHSGSASSSPTKLTAGGPVPAGFRVLDLTWVSQDEGWALSYPICSGGTCVAVAHTIDGGRSWAAVRTPDFSTLDSTACDPTCISHLRFANSQVGYAYSDRALFMTVNGGDTWQRQPAAAYALEVANGTVLRLLTQAPSCAPGCIFTLQRSTVGGTAWQDVPLPGPPAEAVAAALGRSSSTVAIAFYQHTSGGAQNAQSTVLTSANDGSTWTNRGEPCPPSAGAGLTTPEVDTTDLSLAADGAIVLLCTPRGAIDGAFTRTSTDAGNHFVSGLPIPRGLQSNLVAASSDVQFVGTWPLRSTDRGRTWTQDEPGGSNPVKAVMLGFETTTTGRALTVTGVLGSPTIWTTRDAGLTWISYTFE
jgi:photosystem II stability/assembly factor-like uncharacterized protein